MLLLWLQSHLPALKVAAGFAGVLIAEAYVGWNKNIPANSLLGLVVVLVKAAWTSGTNRIGGGPTGGASSAALLLALLSVWMAVPACKASPEVVALTSLRATVSTIGDGVNKYQALLPNLLAAAHDKSKACTDPPSKQACVAAFYKPLREVDGALLVYSKLEKAGASAVQPGPDWPAAVEGLIDAFGRIGIFVTGGK